MTNEGFTRERSIDVGQGNGSYNREMIVGSTVASGKRSHNRGMIGGSAVASSNRSHNRRMIVGSTVASANRSRNGTIEDPSFASFVNPAFDKDDIADEHLESYLAKPNAKRPGTLRE